MPFGDRLLNEIFEDIVRPAVHTSNTECQRGDDVFGSNVIMEDILKSIKEAGIVVADLTGRNANVFYEVGLCHALGKKVLLLAQSIDDVPFDLRHRRVLLYENTFHGGALLAKKLKASMEVMMNEDALES
jgi:nucleoside 2-deoxyribosyltransferase